MTEEEHPFYGYEILREREHAQIEKILSKHKGKQADDQLKKEIYEELQDLKDKGTISIPFKVVLRKDPMARQAPYIEVILDTKL
ncbi:hypothetical protein [Estrella lausannensis]|uniref:Uncharacterized protein n=1 Tax=Estrella lausannensis TaxID=483423 RepID=A0A0H5DRK8_9BACT|nr:hypothetical protein [Estrella lausannensis]CRX39336.1 Conserved hypothetical protein [Estrella lausannensis]